jgi:diguanylate cyclase
MGQELMKDTLDSVTSKSHDVACKALEKIEELGLLPTPENYELWYKYYDGDAELVGAIDKLGDNINEASCTKIYKRYLTSSSHEDAVRKISDQIQQAITEIGGLFKSVKSATDEYGETLDDTAGKIDKADSIEDLESVVSEMVQSTKKMVEHNKSLEDQLNNTSGQMAELRQNLDTVRKEAMTDGLTGLSNRKAFDRYLEAAISEAAADSATLTLLMMDIDHFKSFNDTYGHLIGDQVLRLVARSLKDGIKGRDLAARYGGEEFAIILPDTGAEAGVVVGNLLRRAVERKEVINRTTGETLGQITLSVGVAEYKPGEKPENLVSRADQALYSAKEAGRNQVKSAE